ncbi:MAG: tRNA (adenosine(37)-N6)-dimethylallyltransferase MiaA [Alphaproteobacteria bacterium]
MTDIVIIFGATASGKSQTAIQLAKQFLAEKKTPVIINADALQQYSDLPILSAQPKQYDKDICCHRLYGFLPADSNNDVASWLGRAMAEITNGFLKNKIPIVVGGSGLYIKTLLIGLSPMPAVPQAIKNQMIKTINATPEKLIDYYQQLEIHDPTTAKKLAKNDKARIIRALSIFIASQKPLSEWQALPPIGGLKDKFPEKKITYHHLMPPREILWNNITHRTSAMLADGVLEEYKIFLQHYHKKNLPIKKTIGAKSIEQYLAHKIDKSELQQHITIATRQYAKRQATWYRGQLHDIFENG